MSSKSIPSLKSVEGAVESRRKSCDGETLDCEEDMVAIDVDGSQCRDQLCAFEVVCDANSCLESVIVGLREIDLCGGNADVFMKGRCWWKCICESQATDVGDVKER